MDSSRNIEHNSAEECVLNNNLVDKDVQLMLLPLNLVQLFSCSPRYRIKNDCIRANSFLSNCFSIIGLTVFISLHTLRTYMLFKWREHLGFTNFMTATCFIDFIYYSLGFATNCAIGIMQSRNNIKFVLLFQRVHRFLNDETSFSHFIIWNWIMVIMAFTCFFMLFSYFNVQLELPWFYLFVYCLLVVFDFNIVYAIRIMKLLQDKVELWNAQVLNSLEETRGGDFHRRMFQAYVDILECYHLHTAYCQPYILYYIVEVFLHSLFYIEVSIETLKLSVLWHTNHEATLGLFSVLCWLFKDLTWQTMFMQRCETFYLTTESVRDSCAVILKSNCCGDKRKFYKNVLRLHRASFRKIRVCGLFCADAALQLSLMSLLANYSVVLLQFAFL